MRGDLILAKPLKRRESSAADKQLLAVMYSATYRVTIVYRHRFACQ